MEDSSANKRTYACLEIASDDETDLEPEPESDHEQCKKENLNSAESLMNLHLREKTGLIRDLKNKLTSVISDNCLLRRESLSMGGKLKALKLELEEEKKKNLAIAQENYTRRNYWGLSEALRAVTSENIMLKQSVFFNEDEEARKRYRLGIKSGREIRCNSCQICLMAFRPLITLVRFCLSCDVEVCSQCAFENWMTRSYLILENPALVNPEDMREALRNRNKICVQCDSSGRFNWSHPILYVKNKE